ALMALNILGGDDFGAKPRLSAEVVHLVAEALKLAFADAYEHIADPAWMRVRVEELLSEAYARQRRAQIRPDAAIQSPTPGLPRPGGTVYLAAADESGMMVSFIQSNYMGFGSGLVVPGTGIALQNRGVGFTLEEGHPNVVEGGK